MADLNETYKYSAYFNPENYILVGGTYYKKVLKRNVLDNLCDTLKIEEGGKV